MQSRTRRSTSTIGGAARNTSIECATADRAGARPYRADMRKRVEMRIAGAHPVLPVKAKHIWIDL
jgi:hypothetical protein